MISEIEHSSVNLGYHLSLSNPVSVVQGRSDGAVDSTSVICDGSSANGCGSFKIKVDAIQPKVEDDKWEARSGLNDELFGNTLPSSSLHCVDVQAVIEENAALIAGEVNLFWSYYVNAESNQTWPVYDGLC